MTRKLLAGSSCTRQTRDSPGDHIPTAPRRAAVLVVDDDSTVGRVFSRILRDHDVTFVTKGAEALALLAAGKHFDVILSDVTMPEMSGMDLYEQMTQRCPDAARRVVFITGGVFSSEASAFFARVPNERMAKPLLPATVRALVERLIGE